MKTVAAIAVSLALTSAAWADEPAPKQPQPPTSSVGTAPIELSDSEMDSITAGGTRDIFRHDYLFGVDTRNNASIFVDHNDNVWVAGRGTGTN